MTRAFLEATPKLSPDAVVSRALLHGPALVHLIKHRGSGRSFEVGAKEHFLISRLDGVRTLDDIGAEYARRFGRRLAAVAGDSRRARAPGRCGLTRPAPCTEAAPDTAPGQDPTGA